MKPPSAPTFKGVFFFNFLPWDTFDLLHFYCLRFPTPMFLRSNVWGEPQTERRAVKADVCEKAADFFCHPKTALKDLLQRSMCGFG